MSQGCDKKTNAWRRIATDLGRGLEDDQFHLPHPAHVMRKYPEHDYQSLLKLLTTEGLKRRYDGRDGRKRFDDPEVLARKELELDIINTMNFDVYFLIVWDMCQYAEQENIWWNVRGSGAGSIVAYALGGISESISNFAPN